MTDRVLRRGLGTWQTLYKCLTSKVKPQSCPRWRSLGSSCFSEALFSCRPSLWTTGLSTPLPLWDVPCLHPHPVLWLLLSPHLHADPHVWPSPRPHSPCSEELFLSTPEAPSTQAGELLSSSISIVGIFMKLTANPCSSKARTTQLFPHPHLVHADSSLPSSLFSFFENIDAKSSASVHWCHVESRRQEFWVK